MRRQQPWEKIDDPSMCSLPPLLHRAVLVLLLFKVPHEEFELPTCSAAALCAMSVSFMRCLEGKRSVGNSHDI